MTTLEVQARISAVDNLTGRLSAIAAHVAGVQKNFNNAGIGMAAVGTRMLATAAVPSLALAGFAMQGQAELDRALRGFQVVGNATNKQRQELRDLVNEVGPKLAMPHLDMVKGAQDLIQAGLEPGDLLGKGKGGITLMETIASGAKVAGDKIEKLATQLVVLARSFNAPWNGSDQKIATLEKVMGIGLMGPRLSPDTPSEHMRALGEFGAIYAQMAPNKDPFQSMAEASALQSVVSQAGFKGSRGGMAFKTIFQRLMNPTPQSIGEMQRAGFDYTRVFGTNMGNIGKLDPNKIRDMLGNVGIHVAQSDVTDFLAKAGGYKDLFKFQQDMSAHLSDRLGLGKRDVIERKHVAGAVAGATRGAVEDFNPMAFLEELKKMPVASAKAFAGLHHATKAEVLKLQQSLTDFPAFLARINKEAGGALKDGLEVRLTGWAFAVDRFSSSMQSLRNVIWDSGFGDAWTSFMMKLGDGVQYLAKIDPSILRGIAGSLALLGGTGAGLMATGLAIGAVGLALNPLVKLGSTLLRHPLWSAAIAGGGLAAVLFGGQVVSYDPFGGPITRLDQVGGEMAKLAGSIGDGLLKIAGSDLISGPAMAGLTAMHSLLVDINALVEAISTKGAAAGLKELAEKEADRTKGRMDWFKSLFGSGVRPSTEAGMMTNVNMVTGAAVAPLGPVAPTVAKLEGQATVTVIVRGDGKIGDQSSSGHIKLNTGNSMGDTGRAMGPR